MSDADEGRRRRLPGFGGRSGESSGARGPERAGRAGRPQPERRPGGQADGPESTEETVEIQALDGGRTRSIDLSALHAREAGQTSSPSDGETTQAQSRHALPGVTPRDPAPAAGRDEAATQPALRLPQHDRPVRLPGAGAPVAGQEAGQAEPGAGRGAGRAEPGAGQGAGRAEPGAGQDEPADGVRQEGRRPTAPRTTSRAAAGGWSSCARSAWSSRSRWSSPSWSRPSWRSPSGSRRGR
ncbi:hypothetical protein [Barrientosiimonas endolithica]|uniref:Uncharacterized protein n=1 Tax=Barrientosiimonas endolithica TaxID=1535208 RepID=A0ABN6YND1_9MICO|nr:hypothetical protein [Barrientosiimonas endolithica]BDZ58656.1 hypothetical protein GCM10025872_23130 [Barrientosiimonas endolithica]